MSLNASLKNLTLQEIQNVTSALGNLAKSMLQDHCLALIISNSGEATFTRSGWKILSETGCSSPVAKIIINAAKNYTSSCGEDSKYLLFILNEMMSGIHKEIGNDEAFVRTKLIHQICSLKQSLPCIFSSIRKSFEAHITLLHTCSFAKDLHIVVETFMLNRFSQNVSNHLSSLVCDFIQGINCGEASLKLILCYVVSHFSEFCSKVLSSVSESRILKGFVFRKRDVASDLEVKNGKFIIVWDLSKKAFNEVSLKICNEKFIENFSCNQFYQRLFPYLKEKGVKLLLTPSTGDKDIKLLCAKNDIILIDLLDIDEIKHVLYCTMISPMDNLNEALEAKHIGHFTYFKSFYINNSCFLHLEYLFTKKLLNSHHILLSAPIDALWKEYYAECLNCLKMVKQWLYPGLVSCSFRPDSVIEGKDNTSWQLASKNVSSYAFSQPKMSVDSSLKRIRTSISEVIQPHQSNESDTVLKDKGETSCPSASLNMSCYVCSQLNMNDCESLNESRSPISEVVKSNQIAMPNSVPHVDTFLQQAAFNKTNDDIESQPHSSFDNNSYMSNFPVSCVFQSDKDIQSNCITKSSSVSIPPGQLTYKTTDFNVCPHLKLNLDSLNVNKTPASDITEPNQNIQSNSIIVKKENFPPNLKTTCQACNLNKSFQRELNCNSALKVKNLTISSVIESNQDTQTESVREESINKLTQQLIYETNASDACPRLNLNFDDRFDLSGTVICDVIEACPDIGISLGHLQWEFMFLTAIEKLSGNLCLPYRNVLHKLHFAITKMICSAIGVPFCFVRKLQQDFTKFSEKFESDQKITFEPVVCKENLIYAVLDLMLQLLKIDGIVMTK